MPTMAPSTFRTAAAAMALLASFVAASPNPHPYPYPYPSPATQSVPPTPTTTVKMNALTKVGCFKDSNPLTNYGPWTFQSSGNCQGVCVGIGAPVMGLVGGMDCWCGSLLPAANAKVADSECDTPCAGYPDENCGGANTWTIYLTGTTRNRIDNFDPASASASSKPTTTTSSTPTASSQPKKSGGGTVGIVVGVIVALVVIGAIGFGAFIFVRRKHQRDEEESKRATDVQSFVNAGKQDNSRPQMWAQDSRLDSGLERRQSNGSIADNQDYSRRILQVRNPDGF